MAQSNTLVNAPKKNTKKMADALRFLAIDAVSQANSGHPGMPMGMADIATVLFKDFMHFNPQDPTWPNRDRFVLSNGHGSMLQYGLLHLLGYDLSIDDLKNFRQMGSKTPGHPEFGHTPGVETTTGPLGQGFATAVGMALGQKIAAKKYGKALYNNKTYVAVGDGCLMEGISHEAAELASRMELNNLITLFDSNGISIDGKTSLASGTNTQERFQAYGWATTKANGHDHGAIHKALAWAQKQSAPVLIEFETHIGFGNSELQDTAKAHGSPLSAEQIAQTRTELGWPHPPFEIPEDIYTDWHNAAAHGKRTYDAWQKTWNTTPPNVRAQIKAHSTKQPQKATLKALQTIKEEAAINAPKMATRQASGVCIDTIAATDNTLVSGSADLTGSNNTKPENYAPLLPETFDGNYIHYGVREHAMGAVMNGLNLYGGLRPISGTFLVFADYLRPSLRLSALMGQNVVYVLTHDSVGLGEDGPTHQPVEHLAMLRATPNLHTWRPADLIETAECWQAILQDTQKPSAIALSRQGVPTIRDQHTPENLSIKGGYTLRKEQGPLGGIFIATGSEVHLAIEAHENLTAQGLHTRVVSVPCYEVFLAQPEDYRNDVLPETMQNRVVIEAGSSFGWHAFAPQGKFLCMPGFGASAPAPELYKHYGLTAEHAAKAMKNFMHTNK